MSEPQSKPTKAELLAAKEAWRDCSINERLAHMPEILVLHPQFAAAVREASRRVDRALTQKKGAALSIVAPTGAGKSTFANFVESRYPDEETSERTFRRTVVFTVPPKPSSSTMSSAVLEVMGDPLWNKGNALELQIRLIKLLNECGTRVVIMDNTQDIPERRKRPGVREVGNWVRTLIDKVPALFLSIGAEQGLDVFRANNQARRRSPAHMRIDYFDCRTKAGVARMRRFLSEVDLRLPLAELSSLSAFETTVRMWMATYGIQDYIMGILTEGTECAVGAKRECIQLEDLQAAFRAYFQEAAPAQNPFDPSTPIRMLDGKDEPFEDWLNDGYE